MPVAKLKKFLDEQNIDFKTQQHPPAFTAQEVAESAHVSGKMLAKTVIILLDGGMAMVVMPASSRIRWDRFMRAMGSELVELADEEDFKERFSGCDVGALPPFGNLYDMPVYLDDQLTRCEEISFCAGTHTEIITMQTEDFMKLVKPNILNEGFATLPKASSEHSPPSPPVLARPA